VNTEFTYLFFSRLYGGRRGLKLFRFWSRNGPLMLLASVGNVAANGFI